MFAIVYSTTEIIFRFSHFCKYNHLVESISSIVNSLTALISDFLVAIQTCSSFGHKPSNYKEHQEGSSQGSPRTLAFLIIPVGKVFSSISCLLQSCIFHCFYLSCG